MSEKKALTVGEFCKRYSISRTTFYNERKEDRLRTVKVGRRTLVLIEDAEDWTKRLRAA